MDVRVKRGDDVVSDHHLVIANIILKSRSTEGKNMARKNCGVDNLKEIKRRNDFNIILRNMFDILRKLEPENNIEVTSIDKKWEEISNTFIETSENCGG